MTDLTNFTIPSFNTTDNNSSSPIFVPPPSSSSNPDTNSITLDCSSGISATKYDLNLHIAALFIVLAVSAIGTSIPVISKRFKLIINDYFFLLAKVFGTGIIIATGFIHMFPPAMELLTNPCLGSPFTDFTSFAGLFAMLAALFVQFIQTVAINHFEEEEKESHGHAHGIMFQPREKMRETDHQHNHHEDHNHVHGPDHSHDHDTHSHQTSSNILPKDMLDNNSTTTVELGALAIATNIHSDNCHQPIPHENHKHLQITAVILELGIAVHSVVIGLTLGVTRDITSLLIAISFHQFFEGFALATTALEAGFKNGAIIMAFLYCLVTPIGIALGIGLSNIYEENSKAALLSQGILEAVSAGVLIYDGFVNLLTVNVTHNKIFRGLSVLGKGGVFLSLWLGVAVMSIIGIWA